MKQKTNWRSKSLLFLAFSAVAIACQTRHQDTSIGQVADSSWAMLPFLKVDSVNPVLHPGVNSFFCPILKQQVSWEEKDVFNPAAVVRDGKVFLLYRAEDNLGKFAGTSRIGLAISEDGLHFAKMKEPVLYPDNDSLKTTEWEGGCEDPRIVESEDGSYVMTYTAYDGTTARLLIATSPDLIHWTKHGVALQGKHRNTWSKSGAIVARQDESRILATKIDGKFWMYFGDTDLFIATSNDLIHWTALEENGNLKSVLRPRKGYFDSRLVESGPYALLRETGILLIYNSMNLDIGGDTRLAGSSYSVGQALFDRSDPSHLINRLENNFLKPDRPYELSGQINQVCFAEGLVPFDGKWFLYYGTADSKIAVAVKN
ncbi:MAG: glycoside hydrolase family 130 protein [Cyclobacteriaceae bacterium]|nr:glycoside hydrolase family 130 protein [Cyclobacteriaceae bacterium]MDH4297148.1 glycoside hydrolase family 130 protein [Cyclobacteriaceae bacterium]MDH5247476.1 glycoside hydrolase family 130 protein [Cyclobacteriaceae bacterium]